ncbi:hypothetical protein [Streptomyces griseiscabiei]|uniref:Uncharacterized protein n=2 Tax=Streptomyces griseiscabiei TaxID=2993540 RepID=A0ABU4KXK1_9ACTN|nr:hypothetical protein [Streptomyces griseiscabiei]MBZ3904431.1 hypothetical protein [Streptomyces griseiscabiei]MDX2908179.1 hypothetical protein [Streptomyces griseiscabiei]
MTAKEQPIPRTPPSTLRELAATAHEFRLRMKRIGRESETALDVTRDRHGRTVRHATAATALAHRDQAALQAYATYLFPYADDLLAAARRVLDALPPARHTTAWQAQLDHLAASHTEIAKILSQPAEPGSPAERAQQQAAWPHLGFWADHSYLATEITDPDKHREIPLTDEEQRRWTDMAHAAQRRGELELLESWYAADGRSITLAHLAEGDSSVVVAASGDPHAPGWQVIGHYADEGVAHRALPSPVPPGVLRPDVSPLDRPEPAPEVSVQELICDVSEARAAGEVAEALLTATQHGYQAGPLVRLQELLATAGQFANALDTVGGRQVAAQLAALGRHLDFLTQEVRETAEDLGASVSVLPPHRTPTLRIRPRPAPGTTPPAPPARGPAPARHR